MARTLQDLRLALRHLRRNPGVTAVAVATLALGIGSTTAIFSVVDGVVVRPLPYPDPERLTYLGWDWGEGSAPGNALTAYKYEYWRDRSTVFDAMAVRRSATFELDAGDGAVDDVQGLLIQGDFLRVLGTAPALGRDVLLEEMEPGGPRAVILGDELWRSRFGGDRGVIGTTTYVDGHPHTIVGVLPPGFRYAGVPSARHLLVPKQLQADIRDQGYNSVVIARLSATVSPEQAPQALAAVYQDFRHDHPDLIGSSTSTGVVFRSFQDLYVAGLARTLWILFAAVGLLLLVACVNVANLLLAQAAGRQREMATRLALGARRGRVVSQILTESLLLAGIAGVLGVLLGTWVLQGLLAMVPASLPRMSEIGLDIRVLGFGLAAALATGVVFGLAAGIPASRPDLTPSLKGGDLGLSAPGRLTLQNVLIVCQVALTLVLLMGGGLLASSFLKLRSVETGFDPNDLLVATLASGREAPPSSDRIQEIERQAAERLGLEPGVRGLAFTSSVPFVRGLNIPVTLEAEPDRGDPNVEWRAVGPEYFMTLRLPLVRGRPFTDDDRAGSPPVAIISRAFAEAHWPGEDPIGQRVRIGTWYGRWLLPGDPDPAREIVAIAEDVREIGLRAPPRRTVYVPLSQVPEVIGERTGVPQLLLRTTRPRETEEAVRRALREIEPGLREPDFTHVRELAAASIAQERFNALLMGIFSAVALLLTAVGISGVTAYSVRVRTQEIGIRMALGAQPGQLKSLIVGQSLRAVAIGLGIGLLGSLALSRLIQGLLFGVALLPVGTVIVVITTVIVAGSLASYLPSRAATRVDPLLALRAE